MPNQQKQIFMIVLLAFILVVGGAWALYYNLYGEAADQKRDRVLQNIDKSNQDFLQILENNRAVLETFSTTTQVLTPPLAPAEPITTSTNTSTPTL